MINMYGKLHFRSYLMIHVHATCRFRNFVNLSKGNGNEFIEFIFTTFCCLSTSSKLQDLYIHLENNLVNRSFFVFREWSGTSFQFPQMFMTFSKTFPMTFSTKFVISPN